MAIKSFDTLDGIILGEVSGATALDYIPDALGSVVATVDQTKTVTSTARYKPYGDLLSSSGPQPDMGWVGTLGYNQGLGAKHARTYVRARIYDPEEARWITVDPLWPRWEMAYGYAGVNPIGLSDPTGTNVAPPCPPVSCTAAFNSCLWSYCNECYKHPTLSCTTRCDSMANNYYQMCKDRWRPPSHGWHPGGKPGIVPPPVQPPNYQLPPNFWMPIEPSPSPAIKCVRENQHVEVKGGFYMDYYFDYDGCKSCCAAELGYTKWPHCVDGGDCDKACDAANDKAGYDYDPKPKGIPGAIDNNLWPKNPWGIPQPKPSSNWPGPRVISR